MRTHLHWQASLLLCLALAGCKDAATETAAGEGPVIPVMRWLAQAPKPKPVIHPTIKAMAVAVQATPKAGPLDELPIDLSPAPDPVAEAESPLQQSSGGESFSDVMGPSLAVAVAAAAMTEAPTLTPVPTREAPKATELSAGVAFGDAFQRGGLALGLEYDDTAASSRSDATLRGWLSSDPARGRSGTKSTWFQMSQSVSGDPMLQPGKDGALTRFALSTSAEHVGQFMVGMGFGLADGFGLAAHDRAGRDELLRRGAVTSPFLALAGDGLAASYGTELGDGWKLRFGYATRAFGQGFGSQQHGSHRNVMAAEAGHTDDSGSTWGLIAGRLSEKGSLLGGTGAGEIKFDEQAASTFVTAFGTVPLSQNARLFGSATMGWTDRAAMGQGGSVSGVRSTAFSLGASFDDVIADEDRLTLTVSQPLKAVSGTAKVGRDKSFSLVPSGREVDVEAAYSLKLSQNEDVRLNLLTAFQPGHDKSVGPEVTVGAKYRLTW